MSSVYSTNLYTGEIAPSTAEVGPWTDVAVIVDIEVFGNGTVGFAWALEALGVPVIAQDLTPYATVGASWSQWQGRMVIPPGNTITLLGVGGVVTAVVSGYLLSP